MPTQRELDLRGGNPSKRFLTNQAGKATKAIKSGRASAVGARPAPVTPAAPAGVQGELPLSPQRAAPNTISPNPRQASLGLRGGEAFANPPRPPATGQAALNAVAARNAPARGAAGTTGRLFTQENYNAVGADRYAASKIAPNAPRFLRAGPVGAAASLALHSTPTAEPISDQPDPTQSQQYRDAFKSVSDYTRAGTPTAAQSRNDPNARGGVNRGTYNKAANLVAASQDKRYANTATPELTQPNQPAIPERYQAPNILDPIRSRITDFLERVNAPSGEPEARLPGGSKALPFSRGAIDQNPRGAPLKAPDFKGLPRVGLGYAQGFEQGRIKDNTSPVVGDGLTGDAPPTDSAVGAGSDAGVTTAPVATPGTPGTPGARPAPERIASGFGTQSGQPGVPGIVREGNSYSASGKGPVTSASPFLSSNGSTRQGGGSFSVVSGPSDEQRARTAKNVAGINSQIAALRDLREARNPGITTRQFGGQDATPAQDFSAVDKLLKAADNAPSRVKREALLEQARLVQNRISGQGDLAQRSRQANQTDATSRFTTETQAAVQREKTALDRAENLRQADQDRLATEQEDRDYRLEEAKYLQEERKNAADAAYKRTKQRGDEFEQFDSVLGDMGLDRGIFFQFVQKAAPAIMEVLPEEAAKAVVSGNGSIADYNQLLPLVAQYQKSNPGFFASLFTDRDTPGDLVRNIYADQ